MYESFINYRTTLHIKLFLPCLAIGVKLRRWGESGGVGEGGRGGLLDSH